jgi:hypothetical protein
MVDRVYKQDLPALRIALEKLRRDFPRLGSKTNWTKLRVEPLLKHVKSLERLMQSDQFSQEFSRLRKGVVQFHSDLVYLRTNVKALEAAYRSEAEALSRRSKKRRA